MKLLEYIPFYGIKRHEAVKGCALCGPTIPLDQENSVANHVFSGQSISVVGYVEGVLS
jgi:hypothetical protein